VKKRSNSPAVSEEISPAFDVRTYLRHVLKYGNRLSEFGILLVSLLNISLIIFLFGMLSSIAVRFVKGAEPGGATVGWMPDALSALTLPQMMGAALGIFLASLTVSLIVRLWITAEAYRMLERASLAAFEAIKAELKYSDAHVSQYAVLLKSSVRYMSVIYLQFLALMFPFFLILVIFAIGFIFETVLTLSILFAGLLFMPIFLIQSGYAQRNSKLLQSSLSTRSNHIGRSVANLLRHPNPKLASDLSISEYLNSEEGQEFRTAYIHRQRVGAYSAAISTSGTIAGIIFVFIILSFAPESWYNLPNLILGVLIFRALESNVSSLTKVAGNIRATLPFTQMAVDLFERSKTPASLQREPLKVIDTQSNSPPLSTIGSVVLTNTRFARHTGERIGKAIYEALGMAGQSVIAITGDFDIMKTTFDSEVGTLRESDKFAKRLEGIKTLERTMHFLSLPPEKRTQKVWSHLSQKGRFALTALALREKLSDTDVILVINVADITLFSVEERNLLPWIFERRGSVLVFESVPYASRLPNELNLLSFDGQKLVRHGFMSDFDEVIDKIFADLTIGMLAASDKSSDILREIEDGLSAQSDAEVIDEDIGDDLDDSSDNPLASRRVGYAPEIETTVWYERWMMARKKAVLLEDQEIVGANLPEDDIEDELIQYQTAFGLNATGRALKENLDLERRERTRDEVHTAAKIAKEKQAKVTEDRVKRLRELSSELALKTKKIEGLYQHITALDEKVLASDAKNQTLLEKTYDLTSQARTANTEAKTVERKNKKLNDKISALQEKLDAATEEQKTVRAALHGEDRLKEKISTLEAKLQTTREEQKTARAAIHEKTKLVKKIETLEKKLEKSNHAATNTQHSYNEKLTTLQTQLKAANEEQKSVRAALHIKTREIKSVEASSAILREKSVKNTTTLKENIKTLRTGLSTQRAKHARELKSHKQEIAVLTKALKKAEPEA